MPPGSSRTRKGMASEAASTKVQIRVSARVSRSRKSFSAAKTITPRSSERSDEVASSVIMGARYFLPALAFAILSDSARNWRGSSFLLSTMPTSTSSSEPPVNQSSTRCTALAATALRFSHGEK